MIVRVFPVFFLLTFVGGGEKFQYYLDIVNKMRAEWSYSDFKVETKIQCASLCHRERGQCSYFGYKQGSCNLMKDSLDESQCLEDECSDPGMKIYKLKVDIPVTTTTEPAVTETTEVSKAETTTFAETTTTEAPTTTEELTTSPATTISFSTEEPETTTTVKPETTTTVEPETTTTLEPETTTTTVKPKTTTTVKPKTTTTVEPETTTTVEPETTTTVAPETTTTVAPETTTTAKEPETTATVTATTSMLETVTLTTTADETETVTTEGTKAVTTERIETTISGITTTSTAKPFSCDPPDGAEAGLECPTKNFLLNALGSKSPFFGDALSPKCYDFKEKMYDDTKEQIYYFFSADGGLSITAQCKEENSLIIKYKLCVMDAHIPAITIHCSPIADMDRVDKIINATSEEWKDALVNCNDKTGLQKIFMMDSGDAIITRVIFQCVLFNVPDNEVAQVVGDNAVG